MPEAVSRRRKPAGRKPAATLRLVVGVADHGVLGILAGTEVTVVVAVEMIVVVMQRLRLPPLHVAIFEEDEVQALGMVVTPFTAGVRGIGENGMVPPTAIGIGL
jgi:hypothetical protein